MSYEDFVTIIDKAGPGANQLMFYFMGEPFLNRDAYRMIRYARDMGLYVTSCTNGEPVDPEALYDSGINHVSFQIGGATQETHELYRVRGNLARELEVLRAYLGVVRERGRKPGEHRVELGFIVMKHNEHEVERFREIAAEIGVDQAVVIGPTVRTVEQGERFLTESDEHWIFEREAFEKERRLVPKRSYPPNRCPWIHYAMTIQVNGDVVTCCRDPKGEHVAGNLLSQSLEEVWNGPEFRAFRRAVQTNQAGVDICRLCGIYGPPIMY
jgi:radical SAM protein with 4Fe4S-binding SPASM domain